MKRWKEMKGWRRGRKNKRRRKKKKWSRKRRRRKLKWKEKKKRKRRRRKRKKRGKRYFNCNSNHPHFLKNGFYFGPSQKASTMCQNGKIRVRKLADSDAVCS
jgi:hypothetical protein